MSEDENRRRDDAALDANLSVLGDEGKEPHVGRVGGAPRPQDDTNMEEELDGGRAGPSDGNRDETSERAAQDAIRDSVDSFGKTPTSP